MSLPIRIDELGTPAQASVTVSAGAAVAIVTGGKTVQTPLGSFAALGDFTQSGTGAVTRTVQSKERDVVSVFDFMTAAQIADVQSGAPNLDHTAAIQAAHDAAVTLDCISVLFPNGTYKFSTLNWSPYVTAKSGGHVHLVTTNASGRTIQISDQYGVFQYASGSYPRSVVFDGPFVLIAINGGTPTAFSYGGANASGFGCNLNTPLRDVEIRNFGGPVHEFRDNAFLLSFYNVFSNSCSGSHIKVADPITNSGENINWHGCTFSDVPTTSAGYLLDVNVAESMNFHFYGCSADYLLGMNKPGNAAHLTCVSWFGGNIEWDIVSVPYLQNDSGSQWYIDGAFITPQAVGGARTSIVSKTTNTSTTRIKNAKYLVFATPPTHEVDATSILEVDEYPDFQWATTPTTFVTYAVGSTGATISPKRPADNGWGMDFALKGSNAIASAGTFDLPTGSGMVMLHDDTTGALGLFLVWAGAVTKVAGDAAMVVGAAGANQIGLQWTGAVYRISNGYAVSHNINISLVKTRTAS